MPNALNTQFEERLSKEDSVKKHIEKNDAGKTTAAGPTNKIYTLFAFQCHVWHLLKFVDPQKSFSNAKVHAIYRIASIGKCLASYSKLTH